MTEQPKAVIQGNFADWSPVRTRSVVKLIIEIPTEAAQHAMNVLGFPKPGEEVPVALARLEPATIEHKRNEDTGSHGFADNSDNASKDGQDKACDASPSLPKAPRRWDMLNYTEQAGILCNEEQFHNFLKIHHKQAWAALSQEFRDDRVKVSAQFIRTHCGVKSRSELTANQVAMDKFQSLYDAFDLWRKYGDAA